MSSQELYVCFQVARGLGGSCCPTRREEAVGVPGGAEEHQRAQREARHPQQDPGGLVASRGGEGAQPSLGRKQRAPGFEPEVDGTLGLPGALQDPDRRLARQVDGLQEGDGDAGGGQVEERGGGDPKSAGPVLQAERVENAVEDSDPMKELRFLDDRDSNPGLWLIV